MKIEELEVAKFLLENVIPNHSCPQAILSDNGKEFCNDLITHLNNTLNVKHITTSPFHPQGNAKVERCHRVLLAFLRKLSPEQRRNWDYHLPSFLAAYRCMPHEGTKFSPFFLLRGQEPVYPLSTLLIDRDKYLGDELVDNKLETMHKAFRLCRRNVIKQSNQNKKLQHEKANPQLQAELKKTSSRRWIQSRQSTPKKV